MSNVSSITDDELLRRAVTYCRPRRKSNPRWWGVSEAFGLGSTYSAQLCKRFGLNPDEVMKP